MYSAYKLNKQGDNIHPWCTPFPIWNQSVVPCPVLTVASWLAYRFLRSQVRWSGIAISKNFPVCCYSHKDFSIVNEAEVNGFLEFSCFSDDPWMLAIWSLRPLHFLNPDWTSRSYWFMYCWSLAWRNLSITLLACEMSTTVWYLNILWHCPSLGLEWKLTFSSPVATAEFSKFAGILSAALEQHHL